MALGIGARNLFRFCWRQSIPKRNKFLIFIHKSVPSLQPQRGCDSKPRVGPSADLPWVRECGVVQPQRGCGPNDLHPPPVRRVATPSGLVDQLIPLPRVARASQPWALGRSPFGARKADRVAELCIRMRQIPRSEKAEMRTSLTTFLGVGVRRLRNSLENK